MAREPQHGRALLVSELGDRLTRALGAPRNAPPPIEWRKFCMNGDAPSAQFQNQLHQATNQAVVHRTRQLFAALARPDLIGSTGDSYRFAFRTSTYHSQIVAFVTMQPPYATSGDSPSYARLRIYSDTTESTLVATQDFYYGASPNGVAVLNSDGWGYAKTVTLSVTGLDPDTDYYARFSNEAGGRIQTATVIEMQSMTEHLDGYLPQTLNQDSEVLSVYRQKVATIQKNLWKHSGSTVLNWTRIDGTSPLSVAVGTATNINDSSSTSVSAATPGYTIDMRYKTRRTQTTIPCVMKAFGSMATGSSLGRLYLKDSAGNTVTSIVDQWDTTPSWQSVSFDMPAALDKYDLQFSRGAATDGTDPFRLYAVSIYEYEA